MSATAREIVYAVQESALGTPVTAPVVGTNGFFPRLSDGFFTMDSVPVFEDIQHGGGLAIDAEAVADHYECKGKLKVKLYPSQAAFWLGLCGVRVSGTGGAGLPWPTTEPLGDLASASFYHAVRRSDGTYESRRWAGTKVAAWTIEVSRRQQVATLDMDLVGCQQYGHQMDGTADPVMGTDFPAPLETNYPTGPYTFRNTGGNLTVAGTVRTQYEDLKLTVQNVLDPRFFESAHLLALPMLGRTSTLDATLYLTATPNDRTAQEALTAQSLSLEFNNGVNTLTIDFKGQNTIRSTPFDLPMNQAFMRKLSLKNRFDPTAGTDFSIATT